MAQAALPGPHAGVLSDEVLRHLSAQERFDSLRSVAQLRAGRDLCDLAYANPYDGPDEAAILALREALDTGRVLDLQYTPYGGATLTRRLIAHHLAGVYGLPFHFQDIVLTPGAMAGLNLLFRAVRQAPGSDEVLVITPCWMDYPLYLSHLGLRPVQVPVDGRTLRLDLDRVRAALSPRTRAVVLSQPANPTGIVYTEAELAALCHLLSEAPLPPLLISDECHRDVCAAPPPSPMTMYDRTCVVYSFGKSRFIQGQRIGYVAVSPRLPERRDTSVLLTRLCRLMGYCGPTSLMQIAVRRLLSPPALPQVEKRRGWVVGMLREAGYDVVQPQATFFVYPRTPKGVDDFAFTERLARRGVLVLPAPVFHHHGHFRVSVTASDHMLGMALSRLAEERGGQG